MNKGRNMFGLLGAKLLGLSTTSGQSSGPRKRPPNSITMAHSSRYSSSRVSAEDRDGGVPGLLWAA
jgi:hypothetical protein